MAAQHAHRLLRGLRETAQHASAPCFACAPPTAGVPVCTRYLGQQKRKPQRRYGAEHSPSRRTWSTRKPEEPPMLGPLRVESLRSDVVLSAIDGARQYMG